MSRPFLDVLAASLIVAACLIAGCADPSAPPEVPQTAEAKRLADRVLALASAMPEAPAWVTLYDPERTWSGYTLDFFERSLPILIDMNGDIVHAWPQARVRARLRLLPNGHLLAIGLARTIVEYDWDGNLIWEYQIEGGYAHHDVVRLQNGNTLMVMARKKEPTDNLLEVDANGRVVWLWESARHLEDRLGHDPGRVRDFTHVNSVQVLPANPWFEAGDERFRPGNVLISARNLDAIFLIDRQTGDVVWTYDFELDRQHEAMMLGPGLPGHGNLLLFNNGLKGKYTYRQSEIREVRPTDGAVLWRYRAADFFSPIVGVQQPLPNGNLLIGSSLGRRNFEITREGEIVWQWTPPFKTKRPWRYAVDHCPQLEALGRRQGTAVEPPGGYRHIDRAVYGFAREHARKKIQIDGRKRTVLKEKSGCRKMILPAGARANLACGVDRTGLLPLGIATYRVECRASLTDLEDTRLLASTTIVLDQEGRSWRSERWKLDDHAYRQVELCLHEPEITVAEAGVDLSMTHWGNPGISGTADRQVARWSRDRKADDLSPEEEAVRQDHLKTLGYID